MKLYNIISIFCILGLVSCGVFQPNPNVTIEQKANAVKNLSSTSSYLALKEAFKDVNKRKEVAFAIRKNLQPILVSLSEAPQIPSSIDWKKTFLEALEIPVEYKLLLQNAFDLFDLYYTTPMPLQFLSEDQRKLVLALGGGIMQTCNLILASN